MGFRIDDVAFDDERAAALRRTLDEDLDLRYRDANRHEPPGLDERRRAALAVHPEQVRATLLAVDDDGTPLGHALLRVLGDDWELKRVIVADHARRRGVGRALTVDAVDRARAAGARRLILQSGAAQPE